MLEQLFTAFLDTVVNGVGSEVVHRWKKRWNARQLEAANRRFDEEQRQRLNHRSEGDPAADAMSAVADMHKTKPQ